MPMEMVMKRPPRPSLSRFEHRLAHQRRDAQRRDAVPVAAQHPKTEAVEGEGLAGLGDRARLVDDEPGDGRRFVVGQVPLQGAIEIADRNAPSTLTEPSGCGRTPGTAMSCSSEMSPTISSKMSS